METLVLKADEAALEKAAELLKNGDIAAVPTETVYGLAANALDVNAVRKIFAAKGRPQDNPLILHISDIQMLYGIAREVPPLAERLAERFWPGPLTMIFGRKDCIPPETCGGLDTAAVRMPQTEFTRKLIERCGFPLAAPSANTSGLPSPTSAVHVFSDMNGKIPLIADGGECTFGLESTVICFEGEKIRILRPGAVTPDDLSAFAEVIIDSGVLKSVERDEKAMSPGMKYKHYSPKAEVFIINASPERFSAFLGERAAENKRTAVLCGKNINVPESLMRLDYGDTAREQAERLFACLREADGRGAERVFVEKPEERGLGLALYNRLLRAAGFRVIEL